MNQNQLMALLGQFGTTAASLGQIIPGYVDPAAFNSIIESNRGMIAQAAQEEEKRRREEEEKKFKKKGNIGSIAGGVVGGTAGFMLGGPAGAAIGAQMGSSSGKSFAQGDVAGGIGSLASAYPGMSEAHQLSKQAMAGSGSLSLPKSGELFSKQMQSQAPQTATLQQSFMGAQPQLTTPTSLNRPVPILSGIDEEEMRRRAMMGGYN